MCQDEGVNLQRGMNYRLRGDTRQPHVRDTTSRPVDQLERDSGFELTGEYAVALSELEAVVPLLEEAATIPGFEEGHLAQTKDYAHTP